MFNLRLKQAQCALSDGQLDEAFRLVQDEETRRHRKGQKLTAKLAKALARRGESHLAAERYQQALDDCNRADELGGNRIEVAALRTAICKAMEERQYRHVQRNQQLQAARQRIDDGWLSVGAEMLGNTDHPDAEMLRIQGGAKRQLAADAAVKASGALERGEIEEAVATILRAQPGLEGNSVLAEQARAIRAAAMKRVKDYLNEGRIDLADGMLSHVVSLDGETVELRQLQDAVVICRRAAAAVSTGQAREALTLLSRLSLILPHAKWADSARGNAKQCAEAFEALLAGPLGFVHSRHAGVDAAEPEAAPAAIAIETPEARGRSDDERAYNTALPSRFVLQVDGVGAYMVMRQSCVTVGPISSSRRPALTLMAGANLPVVSIERQDEDYFLSADEPIGVGEAVTTRKLLANGDKIALSPRCRMKFEVPNAASNTAVLALSSAKLSRPDINHVILMDRDILIGAGMTHHIRTRDGSDSAALFVREGRLYCRTRQTVMLESRLHDVRLPLPVGVPFRIGMLGMVILNAGSDLPHQELEARR